MRPMSRPAVSRQAIAWDMAVVMVWSSVSTLIASRAFWPARSKAAPVVERSAADTFSRSRSAAASNRDRERSSPAREVSASSSSRVWVTVSRTAVATASAVNGSANTDDRARTVATSVASSNTGWTCTPNARCALIAGPGHSAPVGASISRSGSPSVPRSTDWRPARPDATSATRDAPLAMAAPDRRLVTAANPKATHASTASYVVSWGESPSRTAHQSSSIARVTEALAATTYGAGRGQRRHGAQAVSAQQPNSAATTSWSTSCAATTPAARTNTHP